MDKKRKLKLFIVLSILILLFVNITLISGYILLTQYGSMTLNPGEKYIVNIPFFGPLRTPQVCGTAEQTDGTPIENVKVIINYSSDGSPAGSAVTDINGNYCITLPEINSPRRFNVYVEYDNGTSLNNNLTLASNDYDLDFDSNLNYSKYSDDYVELNGKIINEDAEIDNGRFEIQISYYNETNQSHKVWEDLFDYQKYYLNIEPRTTYNIPNPDFTYTWEIPADARLGEYKFYIKTSFNAKDHTSTVYFNLNP